MEKIVIGLTGPTGSGKSTVAVWFAGQNYEILDCDAIARTVTQPGSPSLSRLAAAFGEEILNPDGSLNRPRLAALAFADRQATDRLNGILFPPIRAALETALIPTGPRVLLDAPTLLEAGADAFCTVVLGILAPLPVRHARILARDNLAEEQAQARLRAGQADTFYLERCDFILWNTGTPAELTNQLARLLPLLERGKGESSTEKGTS